jgi:hypothetical protein
MCLPCCGWQVVAAAQLEPVTTSEEPELAALLDEKGGREAVANHVSTWVEGGGLGTYTPTCMAALHSSAASCVQTAMTCTASCGFV